MTVQPFAFAELSDVWNTENGNKQQNTTWSSCDLDKRHATKQLLPRSFHSTPPEEPVLFNNKKNGAVKKVRFEDDTQVVENFSSDTFSGIDNTQLLQMGLFITTAALMVFTMDQFTRIGMQLRYL